MAINLQMCDGLLEAACHGKVTAEDLDRVRTSLHEIEARMEVTPDRISDLTDADFSDLSSPDLVVFAEYRRAAKLKNKIRSAIITPEESVQYGLARMFMAHNQNPDIEIKIFYDAASAFRWLGREDKSLNRPAP